METLEQILELSNVFNNQYTEYVNKKNKLGFVPLKTSNQLYNTLDIYLDIEKNIPYFNNGGLFYGFYIDDLIKIIALNNTRIRGASEYSMSISFKLSKRDLKKYIGSFNYLFDNCKHFADLAIFVLDKFTFELKNDTNENIERKKRKELVR